HSDALIRWGGDEFLVASRFTDRADAATLANRVLNFVAREPFEIEGCVTVPCTCSIGWAVFPWYENAPDAVPHTEVLRLADTALYQAKKAGRNQAAGLLPVCKDLSEDPNLSVDARKKPVAENLSSKVVSTLGPSSQPVAPIRITPTSKPAAQTV